MPWEEEPSDDMEGSTPAKDIRGKVLTKWPRITHKKLNSKRRKRKASSLGYFIDTTPGHKNSVPPITSGIKKKRRSWRTPQGQ